MKDGDFAGRTIDPVKNMDASVRPVSLNTELLLSHLSGMDHLVKTPSIDSTGTKDVGPRRIAPDMPTESQPTVIIPSTTHQNEGETGFFKRIAAYFQLTPQEPTPETKLVSFANRPGIEDVTDMTTDVQQAMDNLEKSQQFAAGMALASSLTQSVVSSSRRLTQGQ